MFSALEQKRSDTRLGDILEENSSVDEKYTISDRLLAGHIRRRKNIKSKGMALDIPYLIKKVLFVILLALDTTKMEAKY